MFDDETWHLVENAYCDEAGRNYLVGWGGCSTGERHLHECAVVLKEVADYYSDPVPRGQQPPLDYLAAWVKTLAANDLSEEQAKAISVFVSHAWRLDRNQLMMLARWAQLLSRSIQGKIGN